MPIPLILFSNVTLFSISWLTISYSYPTVISCYKLVSAILVLLPNPNIVAAVNGVVVAAFGGILFNFYINTVTR